jgi:hypothetical protein
MGYTFWELFRYNQEQKSKDMKRTMGLLSKPFESSSGKTPQFLEFARVFRTEFKKALSLRGATNIVVSVGHFYICGFFTSASGQVFYFSIPDVRSYQSGGGHFSSLLYRTAKDYRDFTGGHNQYVPIDEHMVKKMDIS